MEQISFAKQHFFMSLKCSKQEILKLKKNFFFKLLINQIQDSNLDYDLDPNGSRPS